MKDELRWEWEDPFTEQPGNSTGKSTQHNSLVAINGILGKFGNGVNRSLFADSWQDQHAESSVL